MKIGDVVHYVSFGTPNGEYKSQCRVALITEVAEDDKDGIVGLVVLNPTGLFFRSLADGGSRYGPGIDEPITGGTWHMPSSWYHGEE